MHCQRNEQNAWSKFVPLLYMRIFNRWIMIVYDEGNESSPMTGLDRPRGFQEVKVPRLRDNGTGWW